jgi:hypothetical protein
MRDCRSPWQCGYLDREHSTADAAVPLGKHAGLVVAAASLAPTVATGANIAETRRSWLGSSDPVIRGPDHAYHQRLPGDYSKVSSDGGPG